MFTVSFFTIQGLSELIQINFSYSFICHHIFQLLVISVEIGDNKSDFFKNRISILLNIFTDLILVQYNFNYDLYNLCDKNMTDSFERHFHKNSKNPKNHS